MDVCLGHKSVTANPGLITLMCGIVALTLFFSLFLWRATPATGSLVLFSQIFLNVSQCNQYMQQTDVEEAEFQSLSLYILGSQLFYRYPKPM